jgi:acetoin utilization protein AcuB
MIVRNWMMPNPITVTGDTLVSKAKRILLEHNLRALPVTDENGRLRGLLTRVSCLRASEFVTRTQDPHEFEYFANRLKVKDLMVRNPRSVSAEDTMEMCLRRGQEEKLAQLPVVEDGKVVGMISANEIFYLAAQILGVWQHWSGLTIGPLPVEKGTLAKIGKTVEDAGAVLECVFTVKLNGQDERSKVIVRFSGNIEEVAAAISKAGFQVVEVSPSTSEVHTEQACD